MITSIKCNQKVIYQAETKDINVDYISSFMSYSINFLSFTFNMKLNLINGNVQPKNFETKEPINQVNCIKTHDSESRGQEAGRTRDKQVSYLHVAPLLKFVNALNKPP